MLSNMIRWAAIASIAPFLILCIYNYPSTDDLAFASKVSEFGIWGGQVHLFQTWLGRYTANGIIMLAGLQPEWTATWTPTPLIVLLTLSLWSFIHSIWRLIYDQIAGVETENDLTAESALQQPTLQQPTLQHPTWGRSFWLAVIVAAVYLTRIPSTSQGFFWWCASLQYTLGTCLALFVIALLVSHERLTKPIARSSSFVLCVTLTAVTIGMNETTMLLLDATFFLVCVALYRQGSRRFRLWAAVLCVAFVGTLVDYFAPGTRVRMEAFEDGHQIVRSLTHSFVHVAHHVAVWSADPALWCATILATPTILAISSRLRKRADIHLPTGLQVGVLWFLAQFATVIPAYWAMGHGPPKRAQNIAYLVFLLGWTAMLFIVIPNWDANRLRKMCQSIWQRRAVFGFAVFLLVIGNWPRAIYDVCYEAPRYHGELVERQALLTEQSDAAAQQFEVKPLEFEPETIFRGDIKTDPKHYWNVYYSRYYGIDSIFIGNKRAVERVSSRPQ